MTTEASRSRVQVGSGSQQLHSFSHEPHLIITHCPHAQGTWYSCLRCKWASKPIIHSGEINVCLSQYGGQIRGLCSLLVTHASLEQSQTSSEIFSFKRVVSVHQAFCKTSDLQSASNVGMGMMVFLLHSEGCCGSECGASQFTLMLGWLSHLMTAGAFSFWKCWTEVPLACRKNGNAKWVLIWLTADVSDFFDLAKESELSAISWTIRG